MGGPCGGVVDDGPLVTLSMKPGAPPAASGGAFVEGKYHLVDMILFTGPGGPTSGAQFSLSTTVVVAGNLFHAAAHSGGNAYEASDTVATNGSAITLTEVCPSNAHDVSTGRYTANATEFTLYMESNGSMSASHYVRAD